MTPDAVTAPSGVTLRTASEADRPFLEEVYAATRTEELAPVPWDAATKQAFLASQYALQDTAYRGAYPDGRFLVVEEHERPVGRLYLADLPDELRIIDIALLPHARGRGIGSALVAGMIAEADGRGLAVTLHVERWNPAWRLYQRLGFIEEHDAGVYVLLRRQPAVS